MEGGEFFWLPQNNKVCVSRRRWDLDAHWEGICHYSSSSSSSSRTTAALVYQAPFLQIGLGVLANRVSGSCVRWKRQNGEKYFHCSSDGLTHETTQSTPNKNAGSSTLIRRRAFYTAGKKCARLMEGGSLARKPVSFGEGGGDGRGRPRTL